MNTKKKRRYSMLLNQIIRVGTPIVNSDMTLEKRITHLTDVENDQAKNFFSKMSL